MYQCPNCGGNLKFDIRSQMLKCENCMTEADPYSVRKEKDAEESRQYDVTVFTCPQCGGEILGTETSAAEFCSFCGASTILTSRVCSKRRPGYIIPFQKTKEDCKAAYLKLLKKSLFAPKALKDERRIDSFRGIYVPYWAYYISNDGDISLTGEKSFRRGDYIYTDHYRLGCHIASYYKGISYDASSSFDDRLSQSIAPYDVRGMKEFTPAVLSGFYADISDVDCNIYIEDAESFANETTFDRVKRLPAFSGITVKKPKTDRAMSAALCTECREIDSAMFPVWFMSYRNGNRVAYAVVNGQTGKATADIPVSVGKYFLGSLILALPFFLLLNLFFTAVPQTALFIACILAVTAEIISSVELSKIKSNEARLDDKGYRSKNGWNGGPPSPPKKKKSKTSFGSVSVIIFVAVFLMGFGGVLFTAFNFLILPACFVVSLIFMIKSFKTNRQIALNTGFPSQTFVFSAIVLSCLVKLINPVSDIVWYGAVIFAMLSVLLTNVGIIRKHNLLATRRLPQFDRKGGDDRA
ncbi:MAG: hypothetical protein NC223_09390 [Butyrivibrio sp.]|nr:hypothetical protein [Butyrivibrio sp.]